MIKNIFYREVFTISGMMEFKYGLKLAREKIATHPSAIKTAYKKVKELSKKDLDSLSLVDRGYISKVVESKLRKDGGVLDAYNICLNTGVLYDIPLKEIENNLINDAIKGNKEYKILVNHFINENKISKNNFNSLEMMINESNK